MIPVVDANTNDGRVTTPLTHTACVNDGSTGVTTSHDVPFNSTDNVAVSSSTRTHGELTCPHPNPSCTVAVTVTVRSDVPAPNTDGSTT